MTETPSLPPLAGLRVLDFGVSSVGIEVGRCFAEYSADVVKVESSTAPGFTSRTRAGSRSCASSPVSPMS